MFAQPQYAHIARAEVSVAKYVPFSSHVTEHVIRTTEGDYLRSWKVRGISFETVDPEEILVRHNGFNQFVRSLSDGDVSIWVHRLRRRITDRFDNDYPDTFSQEVNERYYERFAGYTMMASELYITLVYRPHRENLERLFKRTVRRSLDEITRTENDAVAKINDLASRAESSMKRYGLEALGEYERDGQKYSKALEFLSFLLNGAWESVPMRRSAIADYLPTSRLFFGCENIEIRTPTGVRFGALLDLKDYPPYSEPGILNPILYDGYEYLETQSFSILNKRDAMNALTLQRNQLIASQDAGTTQIREIDDACDRLINGEFVVGEYHYSLAVFGETLDDVAKHVAKARAALQDAGFQTALVDVVPDGAWFAQLPANWRYRPRAAKITSRNFCGLSSLHNFDAGKRDGNPWGEAVTILKTPSGQPYYFNFHVSPEHEEAADRKLPANTMVIGQTGSGKTVLTLFLLCQALKYGPTVVYFDKDRGAEIAIRAIGGAYLTLAHGQPTGLNPFQLPPTEANILFWDALVRQLVHHPSMPLTPRDEEEIARAVRTVATMPANLRRLSAVRQNLLNTEMNSLSARLKKWCWGEQLGWLLDNAIDQLDLATHRIYGFDYTDFLDDPTTRTPIMMYLLYRTEALIDGRRFMYFMAEFWKPLSDPVFADFAQNKQKTIRKQNGFGVFDTQSPADILLSPVARTMVEQTATFILLPNPRADREDYVDGLKVTEAEFEVIKNLGESSRLFLVKQGHRSALVGLDLSKMDDVLNVLSGTTDNVALLEEIRAQVGERVEDWLPVFIERLAQRRNARI
ncbi:VirB4 family type IV secretion/conjugal transfer ATPase [Trinickia acidisoli]|uniref:VirB4 family type IV secretion/conjugal transfer ATPase n=1 Tax=Trinickia acidisoli TaxID=2767482 RepID=UPI001A8FE5C2|nr:VirB4 family type IV secretion/conjugal transfer ATPase [Trinickia acidisoli]